jgi:WD40 repeat protein
VASDDGTLQVWDVESRDAQRLVVEPLKIWPNAIEFAPPGGDEATRHMLVSAGNYGMVQLLEHEQIQQVGKLLWPPREEQVNYALPIRAGIALTPNGKLLASASMSSPHSGEIQLLDLATGKSGGELLETAGAAMVFSRDSKRLAVRSDDGAIQVWDVTRSQLVAAPPKADAVAMSLSSDGTRLAVANKDGAIQISDLASGRQVANLVSTDQGGSVTSLEFSPDDKRLVAANDDGTIRLWDVAGGLMVGNPVKSATVVVTMSFSPDGLTLATASDSGTIRLWDIYLHKSRGELQGHEPIASLAFSPDGNTLAAGSIWGTVQLWDTNARSSLGERLKVPPGSPVTSLAFPNVNTLVSANNRGVVWQWDIDSDSWMRKLCRIAGRNLSQGPKGEWTQYMPKRPYALTCDGLPAGEWRAADEGEAK